jgi:NO-binding membrane sensor protein with MHYT domain
MSRFLGAFPAESISQHFIANRAITMLNGEPGLQIVYSVRITVASFFVPIFVLLLAFLAVNINEDIRWWRVCLAGLLSGGAICGMHYLGDASISNYRCSYSVANVVGAAVIAPSASTAALSLFFVFTKAWTDSNLRRIGCAFILAGAVSGMHWCAALGTRYTLRYVHDSSDGGTSRNTTVIAVICLVSQGNHVATRFLLC